MLYRVYFTPDVAVPGAEGLRVNCARFPSLISAASVYISVYWQFTLFNY